MSMDKAARDHLQRCFVLHRRDFGNTSLILELFSAVHGRQAVLAKGAKRVRRGCAAGSEMLQAFRPLLMSWSGRGEVKTMLRVEPAGPMAELPRKVLYCGLYLNELLVRLLQRGDPHEALFAFYHKTLTALAAGEDIETELRHFELHLLEEIGYAVALDKEAGNGQSVVPERHYVYEQESGLRGVIGGDKGPTISGATLLDLIAGRSLGRPAAREAKALMRRLLAPYLGTRPLKSRELFRYRGPSP